LSPPTPVIMMLGPFCEHAPPATRRDPITKERARDFIVFLLE